MKKLSVVLFLALMASPVMAGIVYTPQSLGGDSTIGLIDPDNPGTLNTVYVTSGSGGAAQSQSFVFTFGMHLTQQQVISGQHFSFWYDNSSIEVLHANNVHPLFPWSNFASLGQTITDPAGIWPNPSSGIVIVDSLLLNASTPFFNQPASSIVPFFQVTLHVKSAQQSQMNSFAVGAMTVTSDGVPKVTNDQFAYHGGRIHEVPEPSSAILLGAGVLAIGGGISRRRRAA